MEEFMGKRHDNHPVVFHGDAYTRQDQDPTEDFFATFQKEDFVNIDDLVQKYGFMLYPQEHWFTRNEPARERMVASPEMFRIFNRKRKQPHVAQR